MLKLGEKIINQICLGDKKIAKAFLGDKLVYQSDKPIFVEYIESTGTQWLDTGIATTSDNLGFTLEAMPFELSDTYPMGSRDSSNGRRFFAVSVRQSFFAFGWSTWSTFTSDNVVGQDYINTRATMSLNWLNNRKVTFNQYNADLVAPNDVANGRNITLFGVNGQLLWKGRIYNAKISDGDKIIADLRPCIDTNGVACMYDTVSHKYFYNQGTGKFTGKKPIDIDYTRIYAFIGSVGNWATASDSYSILIPIEVGKKYRLEWETTVGVGSIFRYGQTDIPTPEGQKLNTVTRSSPQDKPIVDITAVNNYLVVQIASSTANVVIDNKYLKAYEIL